MKSKLLITIITFLTTSLLISSCIFFPSISGNGDVQREKRILGKFTEIEASSGLTVFLVKDDQSFVIVEADENLLNIIETNMEGSTLKIRTSARIKWAKSRKVFVHYKNLDAIKSSSGANIKTNDELSTKHLKISASSGSVQTMKINCSQMDVSSSSGAIIKLSGKAESAKVKASSGAIINGENFSLDECDADVSSGANIKLGVISNQLQGEASSGGMILYKGNPKVSSRKSSGGQINKR